MRMKGLIFMKKLKNLKKSMAVILLLTMCSGVLSACSSADATTTENNTDTDSNTNAIAENAKESSNNPDAKVIRVGSGNAYNPACYLDDDGNLAGYDYAVLEAVDELLPQYTFTYESFDFQNVLLALESNKIDLAAHQYEWNAEREENYLFGEEGYTVFDMYAWVLDDVDTTNINSLEDFAGTTVHATAGDNTANYLEHWNEEHPDKQINLDYTTTSTTEESVSYYISGKWSFLTACKKDIGLTNESYADLGVHFKLAFDTPINTSNTYFLYRKDDEEEAQLQQDVDDALRQLKASGKLAEISIEYWGDDYTESNDAYDNAQ
jgi:L-cystine transport system substrate-binding protein